MAVSDKEFRDLAKSVASVETALSMWKWIARGVAATALAVGLAAFGWCWNISNKLTAVEQQLADGGNSRIVAELKNPTSPQQLAASLSTVIAQTQTASVNREKPDEKKIAEIAGALRQVASKDPTLPESWKAIATVASYRTSPVLQSSARLPDCNVDVKDHLVDPSEVPEIQIGHPAWGYVFRNCTLHLDELPPGKPVHTTAAKPYHLPGEPAEPAGTPLTFGDAAFLIHCDVVLTDSGIAESKILYFYAEGCRFNYQINFLPSPAVRNLLLASLDTPVAGDLNIQLPATDSGQRY